MKKIISILLCVLVGTQGRVVEPLHARIVNGTSVKLGEIPFQVSLQRELSYHFCGGAIINENYVVTAGHCIDGYEAEEFKVIVGTIDLKEPYESYNVEKVIPYEEFENFFKDDIALIKVSTPFQFSDIVQPVALPRHHENIKADSRAIVSGWGDTQAPGDTDRLMKASTFILDQEKCVAINEEVGYPVYPTNICVMNKGDRRGECNGDSGGPLTVDNKLVGIVSRSFKGDGGCGSTKYPGVYTRVSEYVDWILEHTK